MCGMTREEDIHLAASLGVDAVGVILYPGSRRYVHPEQAQTLLKNVPPFVDVVAVLVNPHADEVQAALQNLPIQYLQFHGEETAEFCRQFARPYIKSIAATSRQAIEAAMTRYPDASAFLLDTPCGDERGGSGRVFDWQHIPQTDRPLILAGGLTPDNVKQAVSAVRPYALDLCSGIEQSPGIKDHEKMTRFITALRGVDHE